MSEYKIDNELFDSAEEVFEYIFDEDEIDDSEFDECLDDTYGEVRIADFVYTTSYALHEVDPIAYRCALADWRSERFDEIRDEMILEIESIDEGDEDYVNGYLVEHLAEELEPEE